MTRPLNSISLVNPAVFPDVSPPTIAFIAAVHSLNEQNAAYTAAQNFIDIYEDKTEEILILGPTDCTIDRQGVSITTVSRNPPSNTILRIFDYIWYQFRLAFAVFQVHDRCDSTFFHIGGTILLLPILMSRIFNITTNVFVLGSLSRGSAETYPDELLFKIISRMIGLVEGLSCLFADRAIFLSDSISVPIYGLFSPTNRVTANLNYIDIDDFQGSKCRKHTYDVIYTGRFEPTKGVDKLVDSLANLAEERPDLRVCLVGDGSLYPDIEEKLHDEDVMNQVELTGWVDHSDISSYLAESRLLVLPSASEGVPKSILEAMACRTVPIATSVGGIPDEITDGETGFILSDNDPETIKNCIDRALAQENLDEIANRARSHIRQNHSYEATEKEFKELL